MPFNAPASIPQITAYYPPTFDTIHPPPSRQDIGTNRHLNQQFVSIKAALLTMLRTRHVSNLPLGFPFQCVAHGGLDSIDGVPQTRLSMSSYEFPEYVNFDPISPPCRAIFSYTAPANLFDPSTVGESPSSRMTWQIKIPSRNTVYPNETPTFFTVSQVELDPTLVESPFGYNFMTDKHILLEALSVSLEQGLQLTVQMALSMPCSPSINVGQRLDVYKSRNRRSSGYQSGDLVFVAKKDGLREIVHVYDLRKVSRNA